jgi:hypothetical protein
LQIEERIFRGVLVVVFPDEEEAGGEAVAEFLAPRDAVGRSESLVDEVERGEQEERLVRTLVRAALLHRRGARVEVVKPVDGLIGSHGARVAGERIDLKDKRGGWKKFASFQYSGKRRGAPSSLGYDGQAA